MEQPKYDVFISYSRKDYVDENKNVIEGNVISTIKDIFRQSGISYWMDEEGNLTGKKFAHIIAGKIRESMAFLFVCSRNSVASRWVDRELSVADTLDKHIIPFICDESYLDDKVIMFTSSLDRIEFQTSTEKELEKLIKTIEKDKFELQKKIQEEKELLLKKQREEEEQRKRLELEEKKKKVRSEIEEQISAFRVYSVQQESILQQLYTKNQFLGNESKQCPVCQSISPLDRHYCDTCGWQFPLLYSLDGNESPICDAGQLALARTNWHGLHRISELQRKNQELEDIRKGLEDTKRDYEKKMTYQEEYLKDLSDQCYILKESIDEKVRELASLEDNFKSTSMQLEFFKQEASKNEEQKKSNKDLISKLQKEIESLSQMVDQCKQEVSEKEKQSQEQTKVYRLLVEKYNQAVNKTIEATVLKAKDTEKKNESSPQKAPLETLSTNHKKSKTINSLEDAFKIIETCCDRNPIQDNFDLNKAKLSLSKLKNVLSKKYDMYVSKSAIIACKNVGELKLLLYKSSNKNV